MGKTAPPEIELGLRLEKKPPPPDREHVVIGTFSLKGRRLTFQTVNVLLVKDARDAMATNIDFIVTLCPPEGMKTVTGRVTNVDLVASHERPRRWDIAVLVRKD